MKLGKPVTLIHLLVTANNNIQFYCVTVEVCALQSAI